MNRTRSAFTLIEVLVALSLVVILAGLLLGFGSNFIDQRDRITRVDTTQRELSRLFSAIEGAALAADASGPGVRVNANRLILTRRSVPNAQATVEFETLTVAHNPSRDVLTVSSDRQAGSWEVPGIERVRFQASNGRAWGAFAEPALPGAISVEIWLAGVEPEPMAALDSDLQSASEQAGVLQEDLSDELNEIDETERPDRWKIFTVVDPGLGSAN